MYPFPLCVCTGEVRVVAPSRQYPAHGAVWELWRSRQTWRAMSPSLYNTAGRSMCVQGEWGESGGSIMVVPGPRCSVWTLEVQADTGARSTSLYNTAGRCAVWSSYQGFWTHWSTLVYCSMTRCNIHWYKNVGSNISISLTLIMFTNTWLFNYKKKFCFNITGRDEWPI